MDKQKTDFPARKVAKTKTLNVGENGRDQAGSAEAHKRMAKMILVVNSFR